jgi:hypothetical protein
MGGGGAVPSGNDPAQLSFQLVQRKKKKSEEFSAPKTNKQRKAAANLGDQAVPQVDSHTWQCCLVVLATETRRICEKGGCGLFLRC